MGNRVLIAMDETENALRSVEYVAGIIGEEVQITLYHVLPKSPPKDIEKETILVHHGPGFKQGIEDLKTSLVRKRAAIEEVTDEARDVLVKAGIDRKNIAIKIVERRKDVAREILKELERGEYGTVVVRRRELPGIKAFLAARVSNKIIRHARNCTVWVVG